MSSGQMTASQMESGLQPNDTNQLLLFSKFYFENSDVMTMKIRNKDGVILRTKDFTKVDENWRPLEG